MGPKGLPEVIDIGVPERGGGHVIADRIRDSMDFASWLDCKVAVAPPKLIYQAESPVGGM